MSFPHTAYSAIRSVNPGENGVGHGIINPSSFHACCGHVICVNVSLYREQHQKPESGSPCNQPTARTSTCLYPNPPPADLTRRCDTLLVDSKMFCRYTLLHREASRIRHQSN